LGGDHSEANAINNRGEVVGFSKNRNGATRAFLWRPGRGMRGLGTLGGSGSGAEDINDATQVVGSSETSDGSVHAFLWTAARGMEVLWTRRGGMRSLGTLDGAPDAGADAINTHRRVVGTSADFFHPFVWTPGDGMRRLPTLGGDQGQPIDLNEFGQIAGTSVTSGGSLRAVLWTPTAGPLAVAPPTDEEVSSEAAAP
jgi:probable HAF family extracellular repeat protein